MDDKMRAAQAAYDAKEPDDGAPLICRPADLGLHVLRDLLDARGIVDLRVRWDGRLRMYAATAETATSDGDGYDRDFATAIAIAISEASARAEDA